MNSVVLMILIALAPWAPIFVLAALGGVFGMPEQKPRHPYDGMGDDR